MANKSVSIEVPEEGFVRNAEFDRASFNEDERTIEISVSSETKEVIRWFGMEVLGHRENEVDLTFLNAGSAPLCVDHRVNVTNGQIGTITRSWIKGKKLMALVRFGASAFAKEIMERVKDGELSNISVGYRVLEMLLIKEGGDKKPNEYRVTKWKPFEVSIVSVAADTSVGIGRSASMVSIPLIRNETMPKENENQNRSAENADNQPTPVVPATVRSNDPAPVDVAKMRSDIQTQERERVSEIGKIAETFKIPSEQRSKAVEDGKSVEDFRKEVLETLKTRSGGDEPAGPQRNDVGLTEREVEKYSFTRALAAQLNPNDKRAQEAAKFEFECAEAAEKQSGRAAQGLMVPHEVLRAPIPGMGHNSRSAVVVGTAGSAGNLVATNLAPSFIDMLYNKMMVMSLGATRFNDLVGNVDFSKFVSGSNGYWVGEETDVSEGGMGTALVGLRPNTVGAWLEISRRTLLQSSHDVEGWVRSNIAKAVALQIDLKSIYGDGTSNTPNGVKPTSGIGAVAIGTNGGAITWEKVVELETEVAVDNADIGSLGYLTNTRVRGALKTTKKDAGSGIMLMGDGRDEDGFGTLNGYRAAISNQVASNLTKGSGTNLSDMIFGNWADLYIGFWSGLDIMANPYANDKKGAVRITALQDVDSVVARAESFAVCGDIAA